MNTVKTYYQVDRTNEKASFSISKMQDIYEKRSGKVDEPHRHNFYTVLIIKEAKGIHKVDFNTYNLADHQIYFVSPGQVHQLIEKEASIGFSMTFSTQFLIENNIPLAFIESLNLFQDYGQSPPLVPEDNRFEKVIDYINSIYHLFHGNDHMKNLSIGAYLKLFFIECNNICSVNPIESNSDISENHTIKVFKKLVNENYRKEHSTSFYAELLHISSDHLNRIIKNTIGRTAKEYIQSRIIVEAKRLFYFTNSSNKEIGYELGFKEPAHFSAFFKKCTGFSPSNFKKTEHP